MKVKLQCFGSWLHASYKAAAVDKLQLSATDSETLVCVNRITAKIKHLFWIEEIDPITGSDYHIGCHSLWCSHTIRIGKFELSSPLFWHHFWVFCVEVILRQDNISKHSEKHNSHAVACIFVQGQMDGCSWGISCKENSSWHQYLEILLSILLALMGSKFFHTEYSQEGPSG